MKFIERVKNELVKEKEDEIKRIEAKIKGLDDELELLNNDVNSASQKVEDASKNRSSFQKNILSNQEVDKLDTIYDFIANVPIIERILDELKKMEPMFTVEEDYSEGTAYIEIITRRNIFLDKLKLLNDKIDEIKDMDIDENEQQTDDSSQTINDKKERKSLFSKLFGKKEKKVEQEKEDIFKKYRRIIKDFKEYYNSFIVLDADTPDVLDKNKCTKIYMDINRLLALKKNGVELDEQDEIYLEIMQPVELWGEVLRYYDNIESIRNIIYCFEKKIDEFGQMYKDNPDLFEKDKLKKILEENGQMIVELKGMKKAETRIDSELSKRKQKANTIKTQIQDYKTRKNKLAENIKKIKEAKSFKDLGYKNKEDAANKLLLDTKEYIVIPIYSGTKNISELFNDEKDLNISIDNTEFRTSYSNKVAFGKINSIQNEDNIIGTLMVPIKYLEREDIDSVRTGKIGLSFSVVNLPELRLFLKRDSGFTFENDGNIDVEIFNKGSIYEHTKKFLGEDFVADESEIENYDLFRNKPNISSNEKRLRREAVKTSIFENTNRDISQKDIIYVNGKPYFLILNREDEIDLQSMPKKQIIDEEKLMDISARIEDYLYKDGRNSLPIDRLYGELLKEYFRINKKARADYINEQDTRIKFKGEEYSIKPVLPVKIDDVAKRYTRPNEDIAYKVMKLANLVNTFAHLTENDDLQEILFELKSDLIEKAIDLSKNNPNINIRRNFDENKMAASVIMEIPGYNMIALHIMNKKMSLISKSNQLDKNNLDVVGTSTIMYPGVNKKLLTEMKKMNSEERMKFLLNLDNHVFYKLIIRMGYYNLNISTNEEKKEFIKSIISNEKIDELLKQYNEIEK